MITAPSRLGLLAFAVLCLLSGAAAAGWASHGEAIFLRLAEAGWVNCL